jgi:lipoprotein LpqH
MNTGAVAVGAAILFAVLVGCSPTHSPTSVSSTASTPSPAPPKPAAVSADSPGQARVVIGGKDASPGGAVDCSTGSGQITITIGEGARGATVVVTDQATPVVKSIGIGDLGGVSLGYVEGEPGTPPHAARTGNSYTITGSGTGTNTADPTKLVDTTYQISATCP